MTMSPLISAHPKTERVESRPLNSIDFEIVALPSIITYPLITIVGTLISPLNTHVPPEQEKKGPGEGIGQI